MKPHWKFLDVLPTKLPSVHLQSGAMYKAIQWALRQAFLNAALNDVAQDQRVDERMVSNHERKFSTFFFFTFRQVLIHFFFHSCHVCIEFRIIHGVPTLARVWTRTFTDRNVVVKLENCVVSISFGWLVLVLAWVHRIAFHTWHHVVSIVVCLVEHARAWGELEISTAILLCSLPVVRAELEDQRLAACNLLHGVHEFLAIRCGKTCEGFFDFLWGRLLQTCIQSLRRISSHREIFLQAKQTDGLKA
mmetsp:Transcript_52605/g.83577  ORF Transcript_52605/g.83577 Transcript_52605/m.83577 type:complete len:247 (+) Transcript_52605:987-1727(+)